MKNEIPEVERETYGPIPPVNDNVNLDEDFKRIYELYGDDLAAFFRDARKAAVRKHQEDEDSREYYC